MDKPDVEAVEKLKKDGFFVYVAYPKPKITGVRWIMIFQDPLDLIAADKDFTGEVFRVMFTLLKRLDFDNFIQIQQVEIAEHLGIKPNQVSRAIKVLVDKGIIFKIGNHRNAGYKFNANYGWKGNVVEMNKELARITKEKVVSLDEYKNAKE